LWTWSFFYIELKPLLGWGYGGIFNGDVISPSNIMNDNYYYKAPHFHNFHLQTIAELGILGYLFILFFFSKLIRSVKLGSKNLNENDFLTTVVFVCLFLIVSMVMNVGLRYNEATTVILTIITLNSIKMIVEQRRVNNGKLQSSK
jgi:O-antigen ligase